MNKNHFLDKCRTTCMKIRFYVMSLGLLFALVAFLTADINAIYSNVTGYQKIIMLLKENVIAILTFILFIISLIMVLYTKYEWRGSTNPPYIISVVKNENYEYMTFMTTYIIPLICIDLSSVRYVIVLVILLVVSGFIFVKMDLYYANPILALMRYRLYRVKLQNVDEDNQIDEVILITKDQLMSGMAVKWIKIDNSVWVAKENKR